MSKKTNSGKQLLLILCLVVLLILDFMNIGTFIPFLNQLNLQFWNLAIVVILFAVTYHFIDSRSIKRNEAQEKTGKMLIRLACENSMTASKLVDNPKMKDIILSDNYGDVSLMQNKRYMGLHDLPFSDDQDIKKLAFEGIINSDDFEQYIKMKTLYQNMIAMFFVAPDRPETYREIRSQMCNIAEDLLDKIGA